MTKPCRSYGFVDTVKGYWMHSIPHIIHHIFVWRVVNEECILQQSTTAFETIRMLKESVQGLDKKIWILKNRDSVGIANYIALVLVKHATSLDFLHQTNSANIPKCLKYGFQIPLIVAWLEVHLKILHTKL